MTFKPARVAVSLGCRFCIDERAGTFFKRGPILARRHDFKEGKPNEIENSLSRAGRCCSPRIDAARGGARHVRRDRCHCIHSRQRSKGSRMRARSYEHYHRIDSVSAQCFQGNDDSPWPKPDATEVKQARKQVFSHSDQRPPSGGLLSMRDLGYVSAGPDAAAARSAARLSLHSSRMNLATGSPGKVSRIAR